MAVLHLRDDEWLQVRAFGVGSDRWRPGDAVAPDMPVFEWTPEGRWISFGTGDVGTGAIDGGVIDGAPSGPAPGDSAPGDSAPGDSAPAPILLELPDEERLAPLVRWIDSLGAKPGDHGLPGGRRVAADDRDVGHWLRIGPQSLERLADAWDARPDDVAWYGNPAVLRLLEAPPRVAPRLRVEASGVGWLTVSAAWEAEGTSLTDDDHAKLRAADTRLVRLASGWVRGDLGAARQAASERLAELGIELDGAEQRVSAWQLAQAPREALVALEELIAGDEQRVGAGGTGTGPVAAAGGADAAAGAGAAAAGALAAVRALRAKVEAFERVPRVAVPKGIAAKLRPYQRDGLDFLAYTSSLGLGAILADDVGLGKTLQALPWLAWLVEREPGAGPTLDVCPASVLHGWEREAARFAPRLRVLALSAGGARRERLATVADHDLVLTKYALLRRDLAELSAVAWRAVVLDEAQNIKNPDAIVSRAARSLDARQRLALTGTPLENRALDLWSIASFLNPGYLGPRASFARRYDRADAPPYARRLLAARLPPFMLRRLKRQVAPELPPRIEEQRDCELLPGQRKLYLAELTRGRALLEELAASDGVGRNKITILALLARLRQICRRPALAGGKASLGSGKFDAFFELLEPLLDEGHRVLVFSQFVECLKLLAAQMSRRRIHHHMLTGASRDRAAIVTAFERDPEPAFLVSLKAGGTGLNLTAANYVVLFDPWWNPAVEAQAIDRTRRIGQDRTVIAYRCASVSCRSARPPRARRPRRGRLREGAHARRSRLPAGGGVSGRAALGAAKHAARCPG